jgi:hypothetical protein
MSVLTRSLVVGAGTAAVAVVLPLLLFGIEITSTGSGGLGAVSAGVSEAILEAGPAGLAAAVLSWCLFRRHRPA